MFVAVMILVVMGFMGLAALDNVSKDREIAGHQNRSMSALYAAEAGLAHARQLVGDNDVVDERDDLPAFPTQGAPTVLGDAALYDREFSQPRYYGTQGVTAIEYADKDMPAGKKAGMDIRQGKKGKLSYSLWRIQVTGESADGSQANLEAIEMRLLSSGY